jgi:ElaB/YqjD/DUF883 family membrane-anchored ribosome-binding protein
MADDALGRHDLAWRAVARNFNQPITQTNTVSKDNHSEPQIEQFPEAVKEVAHALSAKVEAGVERTTSIAQHAVDATMEAAHRATDSAKDMCQSAAAKAGDTLAVSRECVRRHPASIVFGAVAIGAVIGYVVMSVRRKPSFGERYEEDPLLAVRGALLSALSPVAQRMHDGYDAACDGVGKAMNRVHRHHQGDSSSVSKRICRVGNKLKFW